MKVIIDTNIFLDVLLHREPFFTNSCEVLKLCEGKRATGFVSANSVADLFYLTHRIFHDNEKAYMAVGYVLKIVSVISVTNEDVINAYNRKASDFEDCLLAECAKNNHCSGIVTRNKKDFESFGIDLYSPEEFIEAFRR